MEAFVRVAGLIPENSKIVKRDIGWLKKAEFIRKQSFPNKFRSFFPRIMKPLQISGMRYGEQCQGGIYG
jgi:hypothetical protein